MKPVVYGIPNCDSVRKARKWLESAGIDFDFVDFRRTPVSEEKIQGWIDAVGVKTLLNKRSTTWKDLATEEHLRAENGDASGLMCSHPTLIKRPVLQIDNEILVGFSADSYATQFNS